MRALNAAIYDAVMVAVARRLAQGPIQDCHAFKRQYDDLLKNPAFLEAVERATADEESVRIRISLATEAFVDVP